MKVMKELNASQIDLFWCQTMNSRLFSPTFLNNALKRAFQTSITCFLLINFSCYMEILNFSNNIYRLFFLFKKCQKCII